MMIYNAKKIGADNGTYEGILGQDSFFNFPNSCGVATNQNSVNLNNKMSQLV